MSRSEEDQVRELAERMAEAGDWESMLRFFTPYAWENPDSFEGRYWFGIALANDGRLEEAHRIFEGLSRAHPDSPRVLRNLGKAAFGLGDQERGLKLIEQAHATDEDPMSALMLAEALADLERFREAKGVLQLAFERHGRQPALLEQRLAVELLADDPDHATTAREVVAGGAFDVRARSLLLYSAFKSADPSLAARALHDISVRDMLQIAEDGDLSDFVEAFPPPAGAVVYDGSITTCPCCGHRDRRGAPCAVVLGAIPLETLATVWTFYHYAACECAIPRLRPPRVSVVWPEYSVVVEAVRWSGDEDGNAGTFVTPPREVPSTNYPADPAAGAWQVVELRDNMAFEYALLVSDIARARSLLAFFWQGKRKRAARLARELFERFSRLTDGGGTDDELEEPQAPGVQAGPRGALASGEEQARAAAHDEFEQQRRVLLASGMKSGPWPLGHRCRCGADLAPYVWWRDPSDRIDLKLVDEAALTGVPLTREGERDPLYGFKCDRCGWLHTWVLGVTRE